MFPSPLPREKCLHRGARADHAPTQVRTAHSPPPPAIASTERRMRSLSWSRSTKSPNVSSIELRIESAILYRLVATVRQQLCGRTRDGAKACYPLSAAVPPASFKRAALRSANSSSVTSPLSSSSASLCSRSTTSAVPCDCDAAGADAASAI